MHGVTFLPNGGQSHIYRKGRQKEPISSSLGLTSFLHKTMENLIDTRITDEFYHQSYPKTILSYLLQLKNPTTKPRLQF